ncbi:MAG: hypothetical protein VKI42_02680 [Synechococcaceae cyanobacterium]|nr:hypothetical protein [Synechococcaceae cyanobacterium]
MSATAPSRSRLGGAATWVLGLFWQRGREVPNRDRHGLPHRPAGIRSTLLAVALASGGGTATLFPSAALAQQLAPNCPLPLEIAATFANATCTKTTLPAPQTFYRYFHSPQNRYGRYLTTDRFTTNVEVIRKLALNQAWGNRAERELSVTLPAGTVVFQGVVGPQTPVACYPGGAQQTFIENSKDPAIVWTDGPALTLLPFQCDQP